MQKKPGNNGNETTFATPGVKVSISEKKKGANVCKHGYANQSPLGKKVGFGDRRGKPRDPYMAEKEIGGLLFLRKREGKT